jgi:Ca2+-binding RTX toxin-like protein
LNLFATGGTATDTLRGNAGDNRFEFTANYDSDTMMGGKGNDVYTVRGVNQDVRPSADPANIGGATITELAGEGTDTLISGFWSGQLPDNVENLVMSSPNPMGSGSFYYNTTSKSDYTHKLIGNGLDNVIDATLYEEGASSQQWYSYRTYPNLNGLLDFRLDGGAGNDTLVGGRWHDTYVIDSAGDVVVETGVTRDGADLSNDTVETPFETSLLTQFPNIENIRLVGAAAVGATGNARGNRLDGSLNSAANRLEGGLGNDTYVVGVGDIVVEGEGEGEDTLLVAAGFSTSVLLSSYGNVEHLRMLSDAGSVGALGTSQANNLTGSLGDNQLWGEDGDDVLSDQYLADILYTGKNGTEARPAADQDQLYGGAGDDTLVSYGGADVLDGGAGNDTLRVHYAGRSLTIRLGLGDGQDVLEQDVGATDTFTVELKAGLGPTDVQFTKAAGRLIVSLTDGSSVSIADTSTVSLRLPDGTTFGPAEIEILSRTSDRTTATEMADLLYGTQGADTISALGGDDIVYGGNGDDLLLGNAGADSLTGGAGNDTLTGGAGADVYRFSKGFGQDLVDDIAADGSAGSDDGAIDTVEFDSSVAVSDVIVSQQLTVGAANLVLTLPATGDTITLQRAYAASGVGAVEQLRFADGTLWDLATLKSKVSGIIGTDAAETLIAPSTSYRLEGRGGDDTLTGGAGNDTLDGGLGSDKMTGGAGNDTYYVDSLNDQVIETSKGGTLDLVIAGVDGYVLPTGIERGQLTAGSAAWSITGNSVANTLIGNAGGNRLDGGAGADTLIGDAGDDTYVVDSTGDVITELAGEGRDLVEASVTYTLGANLENLRLLGTGRINGTGNALDNVLIGNSVANILTGGAGNDRLDGGAGTDTMKGEAGDDTYVVDIAGDIVTELAGGGTDTVETALTYTLPTQVERLVLTGTNAVNGTGNALTNWIMGNGAVNVLNGSGGADILVGAGGNDTLQDTIGNGALDGGAGLDILIGGVAAELLAGGSGADTLTLGGGADVIAFNRGDGADTVNAPVSGAGLGQRDDTISLGQIALHEIRFARDGTDLLVQVAAAGRRRLDNKLWAGRHRPATRRSHRRVRFRPSGVSIRCGQGGRPFAQRMGAVGLSVVICAAQRQRLPSLWRLSGVSVRS